jgi:cation diffusion facilitator CzcD-associated flavoprotein CzcO
MPHQTSSENHLDVLIVGAGLSGIDAAYRLQTGSPSQRYAIVEARTAIGGTWDLFRYPGIRSDSDMSTLGFPFHPWRSEKSIVGGEEIRDYIVDTARTYGIDRHIRFGQKLIRAEWSTDCARWTITLQGQEATSQLTCNFLFMCSGYYDYDRGHAPSWPGMEAFAGLLVYPQFWPSDLDMSGKRVVVIGSGATAVTLVPALAREAALVTMLQRSPSYVASVPAHDDLAGRLRRWLPQRLADSAIRWKNIGYSILTYRLARRKPAKMKALLAAGVRHHLGPDFDIAGHFTPRYDPWDQRLCLVPDADLFRALRSGKAAIATDEIAQFEADGLVLKSGAKLPADIVVSATGLQIKLMGGAAIVVDGNTVDPASRLLYRGFMLSGVPNFAFAVGYTNASWTLRCDVSARAVCRLLNHMARRRFAVVTPASSEDAKGAPPMLDFTSGYLVRASALLPRQGKRAPWRVHQNYALDLLAHLTGRLEDGVLQFRKAKER